MTRTLLLTIVSALVLLAACGQKQYTEKDLTRLATSTSGWDRQTAANLIPEHYKATMRETFGSLLLDIDTGVRRTAIRNVAKTGDVALLPQLRSMAGSAEVDERKILVEQIRLLEQKYPPTTGSGEPGRFDNPRGLKPIEAGKPTP